MNPCINPGIIFFSFKLTDNFRNKVSILYNLGLREVVKGREKIFVPEVNSTGQSKGHIPNEKKFLSKCLRT